MKDSNKKSRSQRRIADIDWDQTGDERKQREVDDNDSRPKRKKENFIRRRWRSLSRSRSRSRSPKSRQGTRDILDNKPSFMTRFGFPSPRRARSAPTSPVPSPRRRQSASSTSSVHESGEGLGMATASGSTSPRGINLDDIVRNDKRRSRSTPPTSRKRKGKNQVKTKKKG